MAASSSEGNAQVQGQVQPERPSLADQLKAQKGWARAFICVDKEKVQVLAQTEVEDDSGAGAGGAGGDSNLVVLASHNINPTSSDLAEVRTAFHSYDSTVSKGIKIGKDHFDVHRYHDDHNLVYGRRGNPAKTETEGFCIAKLPETRFEGKTVYGVITYLLPYLSAREIPILQDLLKDNCASGAV